MSVPDAIIGLGSNLGDSRGTLLAVFDLLDTFGSGPVRRSSLWQTTPVDCPPGSPLFANAVAALTPPPGETPETLLDRLQVLEAAFGRRPKQAMNEPRPLDLDLIAWAGEQRDGPRLVLPHPRAHLRRFVLAPLAELAPDLILPGQRLTVAELLRHLPIDPAFQRLSPA